MGSSNLSRKQNRKKQTRLTFDPVVENDASSSPNGGQGPSPAKVRYERTSGNSRTSRRGKDTHASTTSSPLRASLRSATKNTKKGKDVNDGKIIFGTLPKPAKSSQKVATIVVDGGEDSVPRRSTRSATKSTQNLKDDTESSDASTIEAEIMTPPRKNKTTALAPIISDDDSDIEITKITERRSSSAQKSPASARSFITGGSTYNAPIYSAYKGRVEDTPQLNKASRNSTSMPKRIAKRKSMTLSGSSDDDVFTSTFKPTQRPSMFTTKLAAPISDTGSEASQEEDSDDDIVLTSSTRRRQPKSVSVLNAGDESDEEPLTSPMKRRRPAISSDEEDEDEVEHGSPAKKMRPTIGSDDEEDPPPKQRSARATSTPSDRSAPSPQPRKRSPKKHRTAKQKQMEILKRKRAGERDPVLTESESDEEEARGLYDGSDALSTFEDEEDEEAEEPRKRRTPKKSTVENQDEYDADFVDDEEDSLIGIPDHAMIPLEFTAAAHKPLKEHFSEAVEWCVQSKINPGFNQALLPIYTTAWNKLEDAYSGLSGSKFVSSGWTREFIKALYARPEFEIRKLAPGEGVDMLGESKCDACNRRKHTPTWGITLKGKAYHRISLAEVEKDSEDDDDEDDEDEEKEDGESVNSRGEPIPPQDKEFLVGVTCKDNAENAHTLIHMKYALNDWVMGTLESEGHLTIEKLAKRDKMSPKKKQKEVNAIVDRWKENNEIRDLYGIWKMQLEKAQNASTTGSRWR